MIKKNTKIIIKGEKNKNLDIHKRGIPLNHEALAVSLFVAIIITFQQLAIIILDYLFLKWGLFSIYSKIISYALSLIVIFYYLKKTIKSYENRRK